MLLNILKKRRAERVKPLSEKPVEVQMMSTGSIDILKAFDISVNGIGVQTPTTYDIECKQQNVDLVITLPGVRPFQATGVVRHVSNGKKVEKCFGVEFVQIGDKNIANIEDYMDKTKEERLAIAV
ncbi:MAG: PilZ domain-containing protein [Agarilytica sp.]